jgi:hypothetical protein
MEVGQGPNVGCSAKGKKVFYNMWEDNCSKLNSTKYFPNLYDRSLFISAVLKVVQL